MSASGKVCTKLVNGLQDMVDLGAGVILLNEINCDIKRSDTRDTYKLNLDNTLDSFKNRIYLQHYKTTK